MSADLEELLRDGISRLTAEAKLPPDLADRARRQAARRKSAIAAVAGAATAFAALGIALAMILGGAAGVSPETVRLLAKIATVAEHQPGAHVRDSQFWYIKSWVSYSVCDGGSASSTCVLEKPHERQVWQSVSNQCRTGLAREYGRNIPLKFSSNYLHCPYRGSMNAPTYRFLQSLPTDPRVLLTRIEMDMAGQQPVPDEAFTTIGDLLNEAIAPPRVSAALYRAAALIPGVTVVPNATDAIGRHGIAVAMTDVGIRREWIFSKRTLLYLGERDVKVADGTIFGVSAVLQRAFVDHAGQIPR
jgi:hypothetical protein